MIFEIDSNNITLSKTIGFKGDDGMKVLQLKGIVYHGDFHFTSCIVSSDGVVWFNDGITTGRQCKKDGDLETMSSRKVMKCRGKKLVLEIYTLV